MSLANGATWTAAGTSYLTSLTVDATSRVAAPRGKAVTVTVNGTATTLTPGVTYTGAIVVTAA